MNDLKLTWNNLLGKAIPVGFRLVGENVIVDIKYLWNDYRQRYVSYQSDITFTLEFYNLPEDFKSFGRKWLYLSYRAYTVVIMYKNDKNIKTFVGDLETSVYPGQTCTEVWASGLVELNTEDAYIDNSFSLTFKRLLEATFNKTSTGTTTGRTVVVYYHNLRFDGEFIIHYLMKHYKQSLDDSGRLIGKLKAMEDGSFSYNISADGQWYNITLRLTSKRVIIFRDSLKLIPLSVKQIGKSFKTKHQKLEMDYIGERHEFGQITDEEREYLKNDLLVVKEGLEMFFDEGHRELTIGSCALREFKNLINDLDGKTFTKLFPNLYEVLPPVDEENPHDFGCMNADEFIRKSYRGGWCYVAEGKEKNVYKNGITADVNSLYPSMMHSESGNRYPFGLPLWFIGEHEKYYDEKTKRFVPCDFYTTGYHYSFYRISCGFTIKKGKLPFIQIKNNLLYKHNEMLKDSRIEIDGKKLTVIEFGNHVIDTNKTILTMTETDLKLFLEHYNVREFKIIDGMMFPTSGKLFDRYINKYRKIKMESKGGKRQIAKLFLNSLYGKFASSVDSSYKVVEIIDDIMGFHTIHESEKKPGYIAIGSAITSYARNFTIRASQANYYGADRPGFIYADTDSIHCDLTVDELKNVPIHESAFCHWKIESGWSEGYFLRQKTYIEHITTEDGEAVEPYYNIKCAGLSGRSKDLLSASLSGTELDDLTEEEKEFVSVKRSITDLKPGLEIPSKLMPKHIPGGVLLVNTTFNISESEYVWRI